MPNQASSAQPQEPRRVPAEATDGTSQPHTLFSPRHELRSRSQPNRFQWGDS